MKKTKEKINYRNPVKINEDVWFYPTTKGFDFVVWTKVGVQKFPNQFRVSHKKIIKFLNP